MYKSWRANVNSCFCVHWCDVCKLMNMYTVIKEQLAVTWAAAVLLMVDRCVEGGAQRGLALRTGSHATWPPLIAQLLLPPPLRSSVWKPHLSIRGLLIISEYFHSESRGLSFHCTLGLHKAKVTAGLRERIITCILASGRSILFANLSLAKTSG